MSKRLSVLLFVLLFSTPAFSQARERIVDWSARESGANAAGRKNEILSASTAEVLELIDLKVGPLRIEPGKPFEAESDWLKNLTVRVRNVSDRTISSIRIAFTAGEPGAGFSLETGRASSNPSAVKPGRQISPGEEAELSWGDSHYKAIRDLIKKTGGLDDFEKVFIASVTVELEDGTILLSNRLASPKPSESKRP